VGDVIPFVHDVELGCALLRESSRKLSWLRYLYRSSNALARMSPVRVHISFGILPYLAGPAAGVLCARLNFHPLVQTNAPA
jgi:hypothetical protein